MAENIDTAITVEAWANITIKEWIKKIEELKIGQSVNYKGETVYSTGQLVRSFAHHIHLNANGIPEYIKFAFEYYGRFVDWGVGKGVSIENLIKYGDRITTRRPKPWFSPVFSYHVKRLTEIMAEKYAAKAAKVIVVNTLLPEEKE